MEQYISPELLMGNGSKQQAQQQQFQQAAAAFDFFSFNSSSADVIAPHPDNFDIELDSTLEGFDYLNIPFVTVDPTDAYALLRAETPTCGPPSTITASSESASAYESLSSQSEAYYNNYASTQYSFPIDLEMSYSRMNINARDDYLAEHRAQNTATGLSVDAVPERSYGTAEHSPASSGFSSYEEQDSTYGTLPPTPPERHTGSVYSDFGGSDYYLPHAPASHHPSLYGGSIAPIAIGTHQQQYQEPQGRAPSPVGAGLAMNLLPSISRSNARGMQTSAQLPGPSSSYGIPESLDDPQKKYQCDRCPKAFKRAYNLKTHKETHNPVRRKDHICPYEQCNREFSRKHDLGRHIVSLHRGQAPPSSSADVSDDGSVSRIGVGAMKSGRHRCDNCGKSGPKGCSCSVDVK